jgi:CO/xanthine dehydrogenase FAD-binding subunit
MEPLSTIFKGPGKTGLRAGDIVTAIKFPPPQKDATGKYLKLGRNAIGDFAIVGLTVLGYPDNSTASSKENMTRDVKQA